jgi:hypothetical protein
VARRAVPMPELRTFLRDAARRLGPAD